MNYKEIVELIEKVAELGIGELEIEQAGTKLRIQGKPTPPAQMMSAYPAGQHAMPTLAPPSAPVHTSIMKSPVPSGAHSAVMLSKSTKPSPQSQRSRYKRAEPGLRRKGLMSQTCTPGNGKTSLLSTQILIFVVP